MNSRSLPKVILLSIILLLTFSSGTAVSGSISRVEAPVDRIDFKLSEDAGQEINSERIPTDPADWNWNIEIVDESTDDIGEWPSLALDSDGDAHISYSDTFNGRLRYAHKSNDLWFFNTLDDTIGAGKFSDLAVDDYDGIHIGYINEVNHNLRYIKIPAANFPEPPEDVNTYVTANTYPAIALEANGDPIFAYDVEGNLQFAERGPYYPPFYSMDMIHYEEYRDVGRWPSMEVDANGFPHISYYDRTYGALLYITKDENGWRYEEFVDNLDHAGLYTSLALDSHGLPHISYMTYQDTPGCSWANYTFILKYAYKDTNGYWYTEVVDDSSCAGYYSSIAVDVNNNIHISYYDRQGTNDGNLNYAFKNVTADTPSWHIDVVDEVGDVGLDTSIALDEFGIPHIAYYDGLNKRLKYAVMQVSYSDLIGNIGCQWGSPDCNVCARDVVSTFNSLDVNGDILGFNLGDTPDPTWDDWDEWRHHWQGIQRTVSGDGQYLIVSQDSKNPEESIFTIVEMDTRNTDGERYRSNMLLWQHDFDETIPASIDVAKEYESISTVNTHPGGIQVMGDYLAVGTGEEVKVYNISVPLAPYPVGEIIDRGDKTGSTAALTQLWDRRFLLVVSDGDAKSLDFYFSSSTEMQYWDDSYDQWFPSELIWNRNKFQFGWDTFQNINLLTDCGTGKLYLLATGNLDKTANCIGNYIGQPCVPNGQDWASLYEVSAQGDQIELTKVAERRFICDHNGETYCNFDAAAGAFVDSDHQLYLYSSEHASNGPGNSVKMKEFQPVPHESCTTLETSWVKLYGAHGTIMIDYRDYNLRDYSDFETVEDFGDSAAAARWCLPRDFSFFLYKHDSFQGEMLGLRGTGGVREAWLVTDLDDTNASSGRFLYDPAKYKRIDPSTNSFVQYAFPLEGTRDQEPDSELELSETRTIDVYVPMTAVTQPMTLTLTPQSPPTQETTPLGYTGYGFNLDINDGPVIRETFVFSTSIDITITTADGDFSGIDHSTVELYYWDTGAEQWITANSTCSVRQATAPMLSDEIFQTSVCKLGEYALLGELIPTEVLVDERHDNLMTLGWTRAQEIAASLGGFPEWYYLGALETALEDEFSFDPVYSVPLTEIDLNSYDVLMVPYYRGSMDEDEILAIRNYVAGGGGLVLVGDCGYYDNNPELATSYGMRLDQPCLYGPAPELIPEIVISHTLSHPSTMNTDSFTLNWSQSLDIAGLAEPIVISKEDTWRDDDWSNSYDEGTDELGDIPIGAANETGCGRVIALGDNTFSNADLSWTDNDIYLRNILRWVAAGENCPGNSVPPKEQILIDEAHNNQLSIDWARAQELVASWGIPEYPEFAYLGYFRDLLSAEFDFDRHADGELTTQTLENYGALMVPLYHDPYSQSELSAIRDFVTKGGGLIVIGEQGWEIPDPQMISSYGIGIDPIGLLAPAPDMISDFTVFANSTHPAVIGNMDFAADYSEALILSGSAQSIASTQFNDAWVDQNYNDIYDAGEEGIWDIAAASESSCGRIVVLADNTISDYFMEHTNNQAFLRSLLRWLTEERECGFEIYMPITTKD